ncbi:MAG TPA: TRAP transporter small permease subunit [Myxococcota bacterium]|nr:TRAP transporter small permease subunit [Myxococcota bacterium]
MKALTAISRGIDALNEKIGKLVGFFVLAMVAIGAFNSVARYLGRFTETQLSSNAFLEGQWYLFSLLFLLGAGYTLRRDEHVRVDVFYGRLSKKNKAIIDLLGGLLFLLPFCVFALLVSWSSVANSWAVWEQSPDPGGLPRWPIKSMILVSFVLLFFQGISEVIKRIRVLRGDDAGDLVQKEDP